MSTTFVQPGAARQGPLRLTNPLREGRVVVVTAVGEAEGARGAAAALACAAAEPDLPAVLVDPGSRPARPALLTTAASQKLEKRFAAHLPALRAAARGQVCHLTVPSGLEGLGTLAGVVDVARGSTVVLNAPPDLLQPVLDDAVGVRASAVLLRADLDQDRSLVALSVRELLARGLAVAVLRQRLSWVAERRALFGALPGGVAGGLQERLVRRMLGSSR